MKKKFFMILILPALALVGAWFLRGALATSNPHTWTDGLVGYWSFDGQYTTSTAGTRDVSNNNNWGAFNGGVKPTAGVVGQALSFDGVDDYVDAGNGASLNITGDITVEVWINPQNTTGKIVTKAGTAISDYQYQLDIDSGNARMRANNGTTNFSATKSGISTGNWYHIVGTYTLSTQVLSVYVNGEKGTDATLTGTKSTTVENTAIGCTKPSAPSTYFNGLIDEVRIYNRALGADEVKQHYEQTRRNFVVNNPSGTPPVAWFKMDEATGAMVRDYSVNANNGTPIGGTNSVVGKIGKALNFDGTDNYVLATGTALSVSNKVTVEAWIKLDSYASTAIAQGIVDKGTAGTYTGYGLHMSFNSPYNKLNCGFHGDGSFDSNGTIPLNTWTHVAYSFTNVGTVSKVYINGVLDKTSTAVGSVSGAPGQPLYIGYMQGQGVSTDQFFDGLIDDVRIYNYVRTDVQIAADYLAGAYRTIVGTSVPSTWWTDGLVGYWNFDGQNTTTTSGANAGTRDASGNGNWGIFYNGVRPVGGISGQALSFDGVNDYVNVSSSNNLAITSGSIEAWVKAESFTHAGGNNFARIVDKSTGAAGTGGYAMYIGDTGNIVLGIAGVAINISGAGSVLLNTWNHITVTWNSTESKIYLNGVLKKTDIGSAGATSAANLYIGASSGVADRYWRGQIDEVRIYSRVLSADEVEQHFEQTRRNLGI